MYGVYATGALVGASSSRGGGGAEGPLLTSSLAIVRVLRDEGGKTQGFGALRRGKRVTGGFMLRINGEDGDKTFLSFLRTCRQNSTKLSMMVTIFNFQVCYFIIQKYIINF